MDTPHAVSPSSPPPPPGSQRELIEIDSGAAHTSRIYDYLLGGTDNFEVDRTVADHVFAAYPGGVDAARTDARANRAFLGRAVRYLAGEVGIRQFLDVGTGIPNSDNVHAVAQSVAPDSRVVYSDNDPIVLAHAHSLLRSSPEGATDYIDGDLRDPEPILRQAASTLDLGAPVAVLLLGVLHVIPDKANPHELVATLMRAVPPGSYLVLSHMANDIQAQEMAEVFDRLDETTRDTNPPALRPRDQVVRFFEGLELVEPGVVQVDRWRPNGSAPSPDERIVPIYAAVGRKP
jgi:hypothetical protein